MADGQIVFEITADGKHAIASVKDVTKAIEGESKKWDKSAGDATGNIEKSFSNMAGKIVAGLAAAGIGSVLLSWGKAAVDAASDLAEVQNVVDTVFGEGASKIESWAKKAGQQFGLTELQAKRFTSTLGAMMKSSGLAGDQIVDMTTDLAGLAADMASFYNLDFETAFEKIRSGISGETMPLKQLGINMSVANLEAFALAQGLEKTFSEMDQGEQTMLRYQYIMQATSDAQGDFAKTADGFANAQRRIESSIDSIKTSVGDVLLPWVEKAVGGIASFLSEIASDNSPDRTVLDDFNDIKIDTETKLADLEATYKKAEEILSVIDDIQKQTVTLKDGTTITFEELFKDIGSVEKNGGDVKGYIQSLGLDVDDIIFKYNEWKEATKQLTSTVPGLTSLIDSETGAINGGTQAVKDYLDAWEEGQKKLILANEVERKRTALAQKFSELPSLELDMALAEKRVRDQQKKLQDLYDKYGITGEFRVIGFSDAYNMGIGPTTDRIELNKEYDALLALIDARDEATKSFNDQMAAYDEAKTALDELSNVVEDMPGDINNVADATDYAGKTTEEWVKALEGAPKAAEAIKAVVDYYNSVRDATEQAVNSTVKGFAKLTNAYDELGNKSAELGDQQTEAINNYADVWAKWGSDDSALRRMKEYQDETGNLTDRELEAYEALVKVRNAQKETNEAMNQYKPEGVKAALESQIQYMEDYLKNLETLKSWGVSDEMLAQLSDGSAESAAYLAGLASGTKEQAEEVSALYDAVAEKKKGFTDSLTQNKLTVDQTYSDMVETAKEAMEQLDLGEQAADAMGNTVSGIAQGIQSHVGEVSSAVTDLLNALNPLSALGFTWGFEGGSFLMELPGIPHFAGGTDWVPSNNFPAFLDYGEAVLTAEENRIWQRFKNGQQPMSMDYDALGGVMRDNVKAGGDVYLDGRTVGHVISDAQGKSYRALQRSGWQG